MSNFESFIQGNPWFIPIIAIMAIWDSIWKMMGMWRAARNNHLAWFIIIAIINSLGIIPILYLLLNKRKAIEP